MLTTSAPWIYGYSAYNNDWGCCCSNRGAEKPVERGSLLRKRKCQTKNGGCESMLRRKKKKKDADPESPTAVKFNIGLYQLYIFNIPSWVSFGHFYMSFHKCLSGMPYILRKNISKFVFENSWFQIADAFQSLLCDGRFAAVVNKSRRCWATIVISSLFLWNQQKTCNE